MNAGEACSYLELVFVLAASVFLAFSGLAALAESFASLEEVG